MSAVVAAADREIAVRISGLNRRFGEREVISDLDLEIHSAEIVALIGASGCGKTTLLRILAGQDRETTGAVEVPAQKAVVYQEHRLLPWRRVWQNVAIGLPREVARMAAGTALAEVGLETREDAWPSVLSGGEASRVALARALVREPRLLLLDEPFAALDALTRLRMHALLRQLWERHRPTVVMVTHDVDEATVLSDRVLVMAGGRIAHEVMIPLRHPRRRADPALSVLRDELLRHLGVEPSV